MEAEEAAAQTSVAESVLAAPMAAAAVGEGSAGVEEGGERVYKPPTVAVPSPPHLQRRLSRPPTPISLASLRVPSTTSMARARTFVANLVDGRKSTEKQHRRRRLSWK